VDVPIDPDATAAIVLVGGQGSRLRPLTVNTPKPMLPTAGVPFLAHLLSRIAAAGIRQVVLGTAYRAEVFESYLGDGSALGLDLVCRPEPEPMGTGGGIRHAAQGLEQSEIVVFNGDILSGVDVRAVIGEHRRSGAEATLHLVRVPDPTAFGCVPTDADGRVQAFLEKTLSPPTDQVNAGCYVFRRRVIDTIPEGRVVSVERETFPGLVEDGALVVGYVENCYWRDVGTPAALVAASADLVRGAAPSPAVPEGEREAHVDPGAYVDASARVDGGSVVVRDATVGSGAVVTASVVMAGASIGRDARVVDSVVGPGADAGSGVQLEGVTVGDGARIDEGAVVAQGTRVDCADVVPATGTSR
jgi:mannose-1-phosphate guanylyltransferase